MITIEIKDVSKTIHKQTVIDGVSATLQSVYLSSEKWSKNYFKNGPLFFTI